MPMFIGGVPVSSYLNAHSKIGDALSSSKFGQTNLGQKLVGFSRDLNEGLENVADRIAPSVDKYGMPAVRTVKDFLDNVPVKKDQPNSKSFNSGYSARTVSSGSVAPVTVDYLNAELAKHYGLGRSTAYQEALSNTAYQRAVKDMKAAGLNPASIFGSGKGYTAGGVSYLEPSSTDMISGGFSGSGESSSGKLFSEGAYHAITTAVGLAGMVAMKKGPIGYYISETAAKAVLGALNEMFR